MISVPNLLITLDEVINLLPGHIYWKDKNSCYLWCNLEQARSLGLESPSDIVGKTDYDLIWHSDAEWLREIDLDVIENQRAYSAEEKVTLMNGETRFFLSKKSPLYNEKKEVIGLVGTSVDISQLKKYEAQLSQAKEKAEAANQAKDVFIANMGHDIRTPLSGMCSLAEDIFQQVEASPELKESAELLVKSSSELLHFFERILDVMYFEKSNKQLNSPINIREIIESTVKIVLPNVNEKHLKISCDFSDAVPLFVSGNYIYLQRILLNLIANAVKYTEKGSISIQVTVEEKRAEKNIIKFTITDTGVGIPENQYQAIFEKFTRLAPSYESIYKGVGMGLFLVKKMVDSLQGTVSVKSKEGEGSTFEVVLPFDPEFTQQKALEKTNSELNSEITYSQNLFEDRTPIQLTEKRAPSLSSLSLIQVLLVEDNPIAQLMEFKKLTNLGCQVDIAMNAEEALKAIGQRLYHLILVDVGLPDMNGTTLAKKLRKRLPLQTMIILLTAHDRFQSLLMKNAESNFIDGLYQKPLMQVDAQKLITQLQQRLIGPKSFPQK